VDVQTRVPGVRGARLLPEIELPGMRRAPGVVHRAGGGLTVGRRVGRVERRRGRRSGARRHVERDLRIRGRIRRAFGRRQLQVSETAGVEPAVRERRVALHVLAGGADEEAVLVDLEGAVTRVVEGAVVAHDEEPGAAESEIEVVLRGGDVALAELLGDLADLHAVTDCSPGDAFL